MLRQSLPASAEAYSRTQRREIAAAVAATQRLWRRMGADFDSSYASIAPSLLAVTSTAQQRVAEGALQYVPDVLEDTGQARAAKAFATPAASALVGVAGDGRPVDSLLYESVIGAKVAVGQGATATQALARRGQWLSMTVGTLLSDTGRQAESLGMGVRPVWGYTRMLVPPSCSRCVILAGAVYKKSTAFQRHPGCDCRHIPSSEAIAGDMTVTPGAYLDSLTQAEQDRVLGKAGAQAWREGADLNQLVNARRGMREVQIGGRSVWITSEGTTRRGWAYDRLSSSGTVTERAGTAIRITRDGREVRSITRTRARRPRLMPETIARVARNREEYLRLLRANLYIL